MRKRYTVTAAIAMAACLVLLMSGCQLRRTVRASSTAMRGYQGPDEEETAAYNAEGTSSQWMMVPVRERYAYQQLTDTQKAAYIDLYEGISRKQSRVRVNVSDSEDIVLALNAIMADCPEFFWIDGNAEMNGFPVLSRWDVDLSFNMDASMIDSTAGAIGEAASVLYRAVPADADEYERAKAAYQYVIELTDYLDGSDQNQNIQSVFLNHLSVCAGYARAYQYLLLNMGIRCAFIDGVISDTGEGHAWNLAELNGSYTFIDVTWGDPTYEDNSTSPEGGELIYDYFCITSDECARTNHVETGTLPLPECDDRQLDYYIRNGYYYESFDRDELSDAIWDAVDRGSDEILMKFGDRTSYDAACSALFPADGSGGLMTEPIRKRMEWDSASSMIYYYGTNEDLYIIRIHW